jgi:hypothetical protein
MKIALITDQFDNLNNGTSVSAARFAAQLRARGHEVRIVSTGQEATDKFVVPTRKSLFNPIFRMHGMAFGRADKKVIGQALKGVDIAHLYLPFKLCRKTRKIAKKWAYRTWLRFIASLKTSRTTLD